MLGRRVPIILDSRLKGEHSTEEANTLKTLASQCLKRRATDRPSIHGVIATLAQVQSNAGG